MKIGVISDIHEDIHSLKQVLQALDAHECDHLVCLGDILGYDPSDSGFLNETDAVACIELIRERFDTVVIGNHDLFAIRKIPSFRAGFHYADDWYSLDLSERQKLGKGIIWDYSSQEEEQELPDNLRNWFESLPEYAVVGLGDKQVLFSHHLYPDLSGSRRKMPEWLPDVWSHFRWMRTHDCALSISGHTHLAGTLMSSWIHFLHSGKTVIPLGQSRRWVSCPPVTRGPVPSGFLILDSDEETLSVHYIEPSSL